MGIVSVPSVPHSWDFVLLITKVWCIRNKYWDCVSNLLITALGEQGTFGRVISSSLLSVSISSAICQYLPLPRLNFLHRQLVGIFFSFFPLSHPAAGSVSELLELSTTQSFVILNLYISGLALSTLIFHEVRFRDNDVLLF